MSHLDEARYGRACLLVLNVCPFTLRQVIDNYYSRHGFSSLQDFLDNNKHALFHLSHKWCCCRLTPSRTYPMYKSQWDELYIKNMLPCSTGQHRGDCPCQYKAKPGISSNVMDITLCCLMITNICSGPSGINMSHIKTIREIRNKLIHSSSASLDEITFIDYWKRVETALHDLATHVSSTALTDTQKKMDELKRRMMDPHELGELRKLIVDQKKVAELEVRVSGVESDHDKTSKQVAQIEGRVTQAATKLTNLEETVKQTEWDSQKIPGLETKVEQAKRKISDLEEVVGEQGETIKQLRREPRTDDLADGEPDIRKLKQKLIEINSDTTKVIPISPLNKGRKYKMPVELLYASVVIREEQTDQEKGGNSPCDSSEDIESDVSDDLPTYESSTEDVESYVSNDFDMSSHHNPADLFIKDGKVVRNIYMLGDAAHGKTTYCMWLLKKWCNIVQPSDDVRSKKLDKWEKVMQIFDFVFLVQFRYVNPERASVIDMICRDVFARDKGHHGAIRHVLSSDNYRSLIIIDGLDEWNPNEETRKQLTCERMPNIEGVSSKVSCFFSMRPWVFSEISDMVEVGDRVIEIHGLSKTGMKKVIKNVLLNYYNLRENPSKFKATYKDIIGHLAEKKLKSFMKIPLLAVVCVQIWYKGEQVGGSMTSFYTSMLNMLIERAKLKHETAKSFCQISNLILPKLLSAKENIKTWIHVLIKLGKVAYEGLLSKQMKLVFQTEDLEKEIGKRELQFALDVGLISQKEASSLTEKNVSVHFFHKSIQEFLAVIYIVTNKEVSDLFFEHLSNVKVIMELSNVIMFICGMSPSLGSVVSQRVVSVTDSDEGICGYRKSPWGGNSTVNELYKLQISWYRELQYGQKDSLVTQTDSAVTQTNRPVTFHVSDVYLDDDSDTETVRVTRELLSNHHVDIRSLGLEYVPTDGEDGITNTELCDFLSDTHRTRSLVKLCIDGDDTDRSVPTLCGPSLRYLYLHTVTINTDLCGNVCPPLLTDMSQLRVLVLKGVTLGEGGLGLSPDMVHIESIELCVVNLGEGGLGLTPDMVHIESIELCNVNLGEGGLGLSPDMVHIESINLWDVNLGEGGLGLTPDMVHIKRITLWDVNLGEGGLGLTPDMVHIEWIRLWSVKMPAAEWGEFVRSVSHLQHRFNVELDNTNIDDVSLTKILSSPDFTVTQDDVDVLGSNELHFTRVWPPSQLTHGDVLLYTRLSPLS